MSTVIATQRRQGKVDCDGHDTTARSLLGYGVLAGPFYVIVVLAQALWLRPGFDLARHDVSLLSNGDLGWVQIGNFVITGTMVVLCAIGVRRATASTWAPILLGAYGVGIIAAGVFVADPMNGFPAGAPAGRPLTITAHGMAHIAAAGVGFLALVAACFVMARRFAARGDRAMKWFSVVTGVGFLAAFAGVASGSDSRAVVIAFWIALLVAWAWLGCVSVRLYRSV